MPIVNPDENLEFLRRAIPGIREVPEGQSMFNSGGPRTMSRPGSPDRNRQSVPDSGRQPPDDVAPIDILNQLRTAAGDIYPQNPLSEEERQRASELSEREGRLQPLPFIPRGSVGSSRIPGNPYSTDTRGVSQGLANLGIGIINRIRGNRRGEFEGELSQLREQTEQNQQAQESRQSFYEEHFPEFYQDAIEREQDVADREDEQEFESTQSDLDREHDITLQEMESGDDSDGITTGDMSNLRKMTSDLVERWDSQMSDYNSRLDGIDRAITQAEEQGSGTYNGQSYDLSDLRDMQGDLQSERDSLLTRRDQRLRRTDRAIQQKAGLDSSIYDDLDVDPPPDRRQRESGDDMVSPNNRDAMPQNRDELRQFLEEVMRGIQSEGPSGGSSDAIDLSDIYE